MHGVQAQLFDRAGQCHLFAVNREAIRRGGFGRVAGGDRAVKRAGVRGRADHDKLLTSELFAHLVGFGLGFQVLRLKLNFLSLEGFQIRFIGAKSLFLRQEVVARIALLHRDHIAHLTEFCHTF